ncbi:MAG: ferrous iron transport protein A [Ureaplasma sp.]|nr:ferrous iron transport protein A [Ureaplasma sp.]MDE7222035.1 ferrous iron transport protein A [Ureaplasma sp.]
MKEKQYHLSDNILCDKYVKIKYVLFDDQNIITKLENIGIYPDATIFVKSLSKNNSVTILEINNIDYGIRSSDAFNILVTLDEKNNK